MCNITYAGDKSQVIDIENPDLSEYPLFANVTHHECILNPGDVLYIPGCLYLYYLYFSFHVKVFQEMFIQLFGFTMLWIWLQASQWMSFGDTWRRNFMTKTTFMATKILLQQHQPRTFWTGPWNNCWLFHLNIPASMLGSSSTRSRTSANWTRIEYAYHYFTFITIIILFLSTQS